jgi:hypothetical protein
MLIAECFSRAAQGVRFHVNQEDLKMKAAALNLATAIFYEDRQAGMFGRRIDATQLPQ